jgi:hypothetical protein
LCGSPTGPATTGSACCYSHAGAAAYARAAADSYGDGCCFTNGRADGDRASHVHVRAVAHGDGFTV